MLSPSSSGSVPEGFRRPVGGPGRARGLEALAFTILAGIIIAVAASYYLQLIRLSREAALQSELRNIRTAVQLFTALNRRFPVNLEELIARRVILPTREMSVGVGGVAVETKTPFTSTFLEARAIDGEGRLLDPFGKPYRYNPLSGLVNAGKDSYRNW